ncbi:lysozyme inhibitor LprI family protein [Pantoea sp. App145]|uniref:lysozyme inhibitor LprI family protein n=1 Tax=Pantoea sp. App145 TaxID=3071567 RepID=UPI003A7FD0E3
MYKVFPVACLLLSSYATAQENAIDQKLQQCLNKESSTAALTQCYDNANKAWDQEMNQQYEQAMKKLTGEPKAKLRSAQRAWLAYRDSWLDASKSVFSASQGTMASLSLGAQGVNLVRNQALMLQSINKGSCANPDDC